MILCSEPQQRHHVTGTQQRICGNKDRAQDYSLTHTLMEKLAYGCSCPGKPWRCCRKRRCDNALSDALDAVGACIQSLCTVALPLDACACDRHSHEQPKLSEHW
jgi:hypothetical protein